MTGTRIRWTDEGGGDQIGMVGSLPRGLFTIWAPRSDDEAWGITTGLPGSIRDECRYGADADEARSVAESWLSEFVSSLGAIFPEKTGHACDDSCAMHGLEAGQ